MQLRCKPNELAVISRSTPATRAFDGLLVTTMRLTRVGDFGLGTTDSNFGPWWVVKFMPGQRPQYIKHNDRMTDDDTGLWPDAWLRPIRHDGSRFDETMFWKCGSPKRDSTEAQVMRLALASLSVFDPYKKAPRA